MIDTEYAIKRLKEINEKNKKQEYSLGDVLLLERFERDLKTIGYEESEIKQLSPSYYKK